VLAGGASAAGGAANGVGVASLAGGALWTSMQPGG
jgi:hypothetical protein